MESIRILQDTYENLYALTAPIAALLEKEMKKISGWKTECDAILSVKTTKPKTRWTHFNELDLYYLLKILERRWLALQNISQKKFFSPENNKLFVDKNNENSIMSIRNVVAHPECMEYNTETYYAWNESFDDAAKAFGSTIKKLTADLHEKEKKKIVDFISERVFDKALREPALPDEVRVSVVNTRKRLEKQKNASDIMLFIEDMPDRSRGRHIRDVFHSMGLSAIEDILDDVKKMYYGI